MKIQLIAETDDAEFFRESMHEKGTTVYKVDNNGNIQEVVYFSGSRVIHLKIDKVPEDLAKLIKVEGHKFNDIEIDVTSGLLVLK